MDKLLQNIPNFNIRSESVAGNPQLNNRDNPQIIKNVVRELINYYKSGVGVISKAPGLSLQFEIETGSDAGEPIFRSFEWGQDFDVHFYGTSIAVRDYTSDETHIICDQSLAQAATDGVAYGDHFFTCNGRDGDCPGVIRAVLDYDAESAPFAVGKILTGGTSGFTAEILAITDAGLTGNIYLGNISGRPEDGEAITDSATGAATADGALYFEWAEQTHIPKCAVLGIHNGNRLALGDTENDRSEVLLSRVDQESGIPFALAADYTQSNPTLPDEASSIKFKNAGFVKTFGKYSDLIVPVFDHGSAGFSIGQVNADGSGMVQLVEAVYENVDWGGSRAIKSIAEGLIFVNDFGIHIKKPSGSSDEKFSFKDETLTDSLGVDLFSDFDTTDADIVEDRLRSLIIVNARETSTSNNIQIVFQRKTDLKGFSIWHKTLGSLYERGDDIYATDTATTKVYKLDFSRGDDDGDPIGTKIEIECKLPAGSWNRGDSIILEGLFFKDEEIEIALSYKTTAGVWLKDKKKYTLTAPNDVNTGGGVGIAGAGAGAVGSVSEEFKATPNNFFSFPILTPDLIGLRASIRTSGKHIHSITLFVVKTQPRGEVRMKNNPTT